MYEDEKQQHQKHPTEMAQDLGHSGVLCIPKKRVVSKNEVCPTTKYTQTSLLCSSESCVFI